MNDTFFKNFPSLNSNSKENRKHHQIVRDYKEYLKTCKSNEETLNRGRKDEKLSQLASSIFMVDERNQIESERKLESKRNYHKILQEQINEARQRKEVQRAAEEQEKFLAERRLQSQIAKIQEEKARVNSISVSENDKYSINELKNLSLSKDDRNHVYQYFSKSSPKVDSALFGYRRFFDDLQIDDRMDKAIPERSHTYPLCCLKCNKSLAAQICRDCDEEDKISTSLKPIDTGSSRAQPFSFNYEFNSIFSQDKNILKNYLKTYNQMTNYQKLYGDLRTRRLGGKADEEKARRIKKQAPLPDPLDDLLKNAQYACITGYARSLLKTNEIASQRNRKSISN